MKRRLLVRLILVVVAAALFGCATGEGGGYREADVYNDYRRDREWWGGAWGGLPGHVGRPVMWP